MRPAARERGWRLWILDRCTALQASPRGWMLHVCTGGDPILLWLTRDHARRLVMGLQRGRRPSMERAGGLDGEVQ